MEIVGSESASWPILEWFVGKWAVYAGWLARNRFGLATFLIPLVIRASPEVIGGSYPVGFDTINYYVPWSVHYPFNATGLIAEPALVFLLLNTLRALTSIDPLLEMKIVFPIAYGLLGLSLYLFSKRTLMWTGSRAFLVTIFVVSQVSALRLSWDQLRILFGLSATLLIVITRGKTQGLGTRQVALPSFVSLMKQDAARSLLAVLAVLSNQLTGLLVVPLGWKISLGETEGQNLRRHIWMIPATILLALELYWYLMPVNFLTRSRVGWIPAENVGLGYVVGNSLTNLVPLLVLVEFHLVPTVPLALIGRFRNSSLFLLLTLALAGTIGTGTLPNWPSRLYWIWLLVVGLIAAIYAGNGLWKVSEWVRNKSADVGICRPQTNRLRVIFVFVLLAFALIYSSTDWVLPNPTLNNFTPGGMLYSSVPLSHTGDVEKAMVWVSAHAPYGSKILVEERFKGWAELELRNDIQIWLVPGSTPLIAAYTLSVSSGIDLSFIVYSTPIPSGSSEILPKQINVLQSYDIVSIYEVGQ